MPLSKLPRVSLAHTPTPLEAMPNLSRALGGPNLLVKRDDCTGLALGGNKARQLEFYFGEALHRGADTVIISGAFQSNLVRQAAAAARKLGMECEIQLEHRVRNHEEEYEKSGNVLLNRLLGARIHTYPEGGDEAGADKALQEIADDVRSRGGTPYIIPPGMDHPPVGALGYVDAAFEFLDQLSELGMAVDAVFLGSGSASTHAGFLAGLRYRQSTIPVIGVCVRRNAMQQGPRVFTRVHETEDLAGIPHAVTEDDIQVTDAYLEPGYGQSSPEMIEAITLAARTEGLILDPVYTGKVMAGMIGLIRSGDFGPGQNLVFLHTGGAPALFGYRKEFDGV